MDLRFFYIVLAKEPYEGNEEMQSGLRRFLRNCGIEPIEAFDGDFVRNSDGEHVYTALVIRCMETFKGALDLLKTTRKWNETTHEGLPALF